MGQLGGHGSYSQGPLPHPAFSVTHPVLGTCFLRINGICSHCLGMGHIKLETVVGSASRFPKCCCRSRVSIWSPHCPVHQQFSLGVCMVPSHFLLYCTLSLPHLPAAVICFEPLPVHLPHGRPDWCFHPSELHHPNPAFWDPHVLLTPQPQGCLVAFAWEK